MASEHRVVLGMRADGVWYAECRRCNWTYENTSPSIVRNAADQHGEVVPGGYLPRAQVEALVLDMMEPPGSDDDGDD